MADPLSIAASIAGLINLAQTLIIPLVRFIGDAKLSHKELQAIKREMQSLCGVLGMIERLVAEVDSQGCVCSGDGLFQGRPSCKLVDRIAPMTVLVDQIKSCETILKELDELLLQIPLDPSKRSAKLFGALKAVIKKDTVRRCLDRLERQKRNFELALV